MRKLFAFSVLCAATLFAAAASAADVTGKWVAQMPGPGGQTREVTFNLKADGDKLTGTVTTPRGESEISDGKVEGDHISFTQTFEFNGNSMKILYDGKVNGDQIEFTRKREGGGGQGGRGGRGGRGGMGGTFTAKRAS
jgi:hypothetical protein